MKIVRNISIAAVTCVLAFVIFSGIALAVSGVELDLQHDSTASGSGTSASDSFELVSVTGRVVSGTSESTGYRLVSGFQIGNSFAETYLHGDADGNGVINIGDITQVARIILTIDDPTPGADTDGNGSVNVLDIAGIVKIILGLD